MEKQEHQLKTQPFSFPISSTARIAEEKTDPAAEVLLPLIPKAAPYRPRQATTPIHWLLWSFVFVLTVASSATIGALLALFTPLSPAIVPPQRHPQTLARSDGTLLGGRWYADFQYKLSRPVNILIMGIDRVPDAPANSSSVFLGRSDTILLLRLDPRDNSARLLSIPRDTRVTIPKFGVTKINQANVEGGAALAARAVSRNLNNVEIDRYIRVTTDAFRDLVDLVDGVEVFIPQHMFYVDRTQQLTIDLPQGWQTLSGKEAEQFARFRNDGQGDIGRVQRQQILLKALRQRLTNPAILPRLPKLVQMMQQYVDTNLSVEEMLALVGFGMKLDREDIHMVMLPGRFSQANEFSTSYWIADRQGRDRIMSDFFDLETARLSDPSFQQLVRDRPLSDFRIAIQNASGQPDAGQYVARHLQEKGLWNVYLVQDWPASLRQTQIIVQGGDTQGATTLRRVVGMGKIEAASVGELGSDLTVRVGRDWVEYYRDRN